MFIINTLNWFTVSDYFEHNTCTPFRRMGYCCHPRRRKDGRNPCEYNQACADSCKAIGLGETPEIGVADLIKRATHFICNRHNCGHSACVESEKVVVWLQEQRQLMATKKAA